jgi:hypothetical protein
MHGGPVGETQRDRTLKLTAAALGLLIVVVTLVMAVRACDLEARKCEDPFDDYC